MKGKGDFYHQSEAGLSHPSQHPAWFAAHHFTPPTICPPAYCLSHSLLNISSFRALEKCWLSQWLNFGEHRRMSSQANSESAKPWQPSWGHWSPANGVDHATLLDALQLSQRLQSAGLLQGWVSPDDARTKWAEVTSVKTWRKSTERWPCAMNR